MEFESSILDDEGTQKEADTSLIDQAIDAALKQTSIAAEPTNAGSPAS